jgi:uncharacterized protein (TIGR02117 family)
MRFKRAFSFLLKIIAGIFGAIICYIIFAIALPLFPVNAKETTAPKTEMIYILTNGVHTDLVVPVKNEIMDWSKEILFKNTLSEKTDYKYLAVGWGDKEFYLNTPTWADLKFSTAFKAAFGLSASALHCTFYYDMPANKDCKAIRVTKTEYQNLVDFIKQKFRRDNNGKVIFIKTDAVYGNNDAFYEATGSYNMFHSCNTWANNGLKAAGQKAALWTVTDFGIFRHYK